MSDKVKNKVYEALSNDMDSYDKTQLKYNPSYAKTQPAVIDLIDHQWSDKFRDGDKDKKGWKKAFYNVVVNPTLVASKQVDLDTKDIRITAEEGQSYYPAWFFGKEFRHWMKDTTFGQTLNHFVYNNPKYGSTIFKKVKGDVKIVPIQNIIFDPEESDLNKTPFIIEEHNETLEDFKKRKYDNADKIQSTDGMVTFYERVGAIDGEKYNYVITDEQGNLFHYDTIEVKDLYRKHNWEDIPGRALGRGQVEKLFEAQLHTNRVAHYKTQGLHWTSKHVFQTRDSTFRKNLTTNVENGDVLTVQSEIQPIAMEERNLHSYREEEARWDRLIDKLSFAVPSLQGERTPSGIPLGTTVAQIQMAGGFFDLKREDMGMFLKNLIYDWVMPEFKKTKISEHSIMMSEFTTDELEKLRRALSTHKSNRAVIDFIIKNGIRKATPDRVELIKKLEKEKVGKAKDITIPSSFYDNLKYKIDILITSEQVDMGAKLATLQTVLTMFGSNPTFLQNPHAKSVFYQMLDLVGISPTQFDEPEEDLQSFAQVGGSMPRVAPTAMPNPINAPATV